MAKVFTDLSEYLKNNNICVLKNGKFNGELTYYTDIDIFYINGLNKLSDFKILLNLESFIIRRFYKIPYDKEFACCGCGQYATYSCRCKRDSYFVKKEGNDIYIKISKLNYICSSDLYYISCNYNLILYTGGINKKKYIAIQNATII